MLVTAPPLVVVKITSLAPAVPAGTSTVIEVALTFETEVPETPPNVTPVVLDKFVPVIVIVVPPAVGPEANPVLDSTDEIVGAAT